MSESTTLGFVEETESWLLESRFFPSKVGGKPAWLDLKNIPKAEDVMCGNCNKPCIFLCQLYAPFEENERAFHRTIYVFICKNPDCCKENQNENIKVFRTQLERKNEFYPFDPPTEDKDWRSDIKVEKWLKVCHLCGISAGSHCSKCQKVWYCCREHQIIDWKECHKTFCGLDEKANCNCTFLFPEYELVTEIEGNFEESCVKDFSEEDELKKYQSLIQCGEAGTLQSEKDIDSDLLNMANSLEDKTFQKFQKKIKNQPEQVLRYNRGGKPIFISSENQPKIIPSCSKCGGERQFEFQIMPQLLNYLKITDNINSIDWGTLLTYTCKESCESKSKYVEEYIWKQDITKDNTDCE